MKFIAVAYGALPCALAVFQINGKDADAEEFGESYDACPAAAEPYGCGDRIFSKHEAPAAGVCECYDITEEQWREVAEELESTLHAGACGWCV